MSSTTHGRVVRLGAAVAEAGFDAYFAHSPTTLGYLYGLFEDAGERFATLAISSKGEARFLAPALSETQARRCGIQDVRVWSDGEDPLALLERLAEDWRLRSGIIAVDDTMPAQLLLQMQSCLPAALFKAGGKLLASLTSRKDPEELDLMRQAAKIADEAFLEVLPTIRAGLTELELDASLRAAMKTRGGEPAFCIVATGPNGAEPHHGSDNTVIKPGDVIVLDFGCDVGGYKSDITRTVSIAPVPAKAREVYDVVFRAHMAGRQAVVLGANGEDVDAAARAVIEDAGYGKQFFHRTGHGIGMRLHEEPNIVRGNLELLEVGNAFSIEPGIYLPGEFGVRIENILTVSADGGVNLNAEPSTTLIEIV